MLVNPDPQRESRRFFDLLLLVAVGWYVILVLFTQRIQIVASCLVFKLFLLFPGFHPLMWPESSQSPWR
jgi:hypothetical protein